MHNVKLLASILDGKIVPPGGTFSLNEYVGQRTPNGLVTCLTDGHPGVSGGGVLDQRGNLVGIPIGRMQGDYRFSLILPIRAEMLRKLPAYEQSEPLPHTAIAADQH